MKESLKIMATDLADKNKVVSFKQNSLFDALEFDRGNEKLLSELSKKISISVQNDLGLIKGKIIPLMQEYVAYLNDRVLNAKETSETSLFNVIENNIPDVVKEMQDKNIINPKRAVSELPVSQVNIPVPSKDVIRSVFKHKINSIAVYGNKIVSSYDDEALATLWEKYFSNISKSNAAIDNLYYSSTGFNELVMVFLALSNLREERVAGVRVNESIYKEVVNKFYSEVLNYIAIRIEKYSNEVKTNKLVNSFKNQYTVVVNADVYDVFLNNGGSPEVLFGLLLNKPNNVTGLILKNIELRKDEYLSTWNKKVKVTRMNSKFGELKKYQAIYSISLRHLFDELLPDDLKELVSSDINQAETILADILKKEPIDEVMDTQYMAKEILEHILFPETNFKRFTSYMLEYQKLDNTITPKDAASFASLDMIMDYLLQQVNSEDI